MRPDLALLTLNDVLDCLSDYYYEHSYSNRESYDRKLKREIKASEEWRGFLKELAELAETRKLHVGQVRSGASYISQNDLRVHFGLGQATRADLVEIKWPSGAVDTLQNVEADQVIYVEEGKGVGKKQKFLRPSS